MSEGAHLETNEAVKKLREVGWVGCKNSNVVVRGALKRRYDLFKRGMHGWELATRQIEFIDAPAD